jgi:hypothetical protein
MRADQRQNKFPDVRLPMCVLATLLCVYPADASAASIFTGCWYGKSRFSREILQQLGPFVEELSVARDDRWCGVIGHGACETFVCDFEVEGGILDLSLSDTEEVARVNLDMRQVWRVNARSGRARAVRGAHPRSLDRRGPRKVDPYHAGPIEDKTRVAEPGLAVMALAADAESYCRMADR